MPIETAKYLPKSLERATGFDLSTGICDFVIEDMQNATMTNEQETVYQTGKNGVRIGASDRNKASRMSFANGALSDGALATQVGTDVVTEATTVPSWLDAMQATGTAPNLTCTTEYTAIGTTGAEIGYIYARNPDGTLGASYPQAATASATAFAYDPATKKIVLPTSGFAANDGVVAFYDFQVSSAKRITNDVDKYSKTVKLVVDAIFADTCGKDYYGKIIYYRAHANGAFDITFGEDSFVHNIELEALYSGCTSDSRKILWDMIIFDQADAT